MEEVDNIVTFSAKLFGKSLDDIKPDQVRDLVDSTTTKKYDASYSNTGHLERLELLGDKIIAAMFDTFCMTCGDLAKLKRIEGGEWVITRLNIKYLSTSWMSRLCRDIGLDRYIKYHQNESKFVDQINEDALEAWVGACKLIFGYDSVEKFMFNKFDALGVDISFESLFDPKTIFNDFVNNISGNRSKYSTSRIDSIDGSESYWKSFASVSDYEYEGEGSASTEKIAENNAALDWLRWFRQTSPVKYYEIYKSLNIYIKWRKIYGEYQKGYISPCASPCTSPRASPQRKIKRLNNCRDTYDSKMKRQERR